VLVLLTDGSGLTARQSATMLDRAGHRAEVLSPDPFCLCRFNRHVRRVHRVPACGPAPFAWLDAALEHYARIGADLFMPTQEQVAVLSAAPGRLAAAGVRTVVPPFAALAQIQDKVSAFATLQRLGLPQPPARVLRTPAELSTWDDFPVFLKLPIGTATSGVRRIDSTTELRALPAEWTSAVRSDGLLAQRPVSGHLVMAQSVFAAGTLIACHTTVRNRLGVRGGASHKQSATLPVIADMMRALGAGLRWHGALSADVILGPDGPVLIDLNPRLVEPANADRSGVDLVGPLLEIATGRSPQPQPAPRAGVNTHQLLLAVLGAAENNGRRGVAGELLTAGRRRGAYRDSAEELTPVRGDPRAALPGHGCRDRGPAVARELETLRLDRGRRLCADPRGLAGDPGPYGGAPRGTSTFICCPMW
jgi:biotin carboxylase